MLTETLVVFQRQMRILLRNPIWVVFGLTQPIIYLVLFGPLLKKVTGGGLGGDDAWRIFVPGLLMQLAIFGAGFAGFGMIQELREGVIDRQRVTPARRLSLILGRTLSNTVTIAVQGAVLIAGRHPVRAERPPGAASSRSLACICVLAVGISAASYAMGLILKDEDAFAPFIQGVSLPLLLLSGVLLPMSLAPAWLRHSLQGQSAHARRRRTRSLFRGDFGDSDVLLGAGIAIALSALLAWWGAPASFSARVPESLSPSLTTTTPAMISAPPSELQRARELVEQQPRERRRRRRPRAARRTRRGASRAAGSRRSRCSRRARR